MITRCKILRGDAWGLSFDAAAAATDAAEGGWIQTLASLCHLQPRLHKSTQIGKRKIVGDCSLLPIAQL